MFHVCYCCYEAAKVHSHFIGLCHGEFERRCYSNLEKCVYARARRLNCFKIPVIGSRGLDPIESVTGHLSSPEAGQFKKAVAWETTALEVGGNIDRDEFKARLAMYRKGRAYLSPDSTSCFF